MFHFISWQAYWTTLAITAVVYYLSIYFLYFRNDINISLPFLNNRDRQPNDLSTFTHSTTNSDPSVVSSPDRSEDSFSPASEGSQEQLVYSLMDEVHAFFEGAKKQKWNPQSLQNSLRIIVAKYAPLRGSEYQSSITNVLLTESEHHCSIHFRMEELEKVWLDEVK